MCPIFVGSVDNFGKRYEKKIKIPLYQLLKLLLSLDAQPEIQILKGH